MTPSKTGLYAKKGTYMSGMPTDERHVCPLCGGTMVRTARRTIDRLLSRFVPLFRYRCEKFLCRWQGNIRMNPLQEAQDSGLSRPTRLF